MLRKIILVLVLIASLSKAGGKVTVSVEMDSTVILIGQQAHIALKVVADSQQNITFPVFPQKQIIPGVEVIEEKITGTEELNDGRQKSITKIYTITSFDSTLYYIPPFKVRVDNKTYDSKSLALKVETMDVDTLHLDKFFGPKEIADVPFSWKDWRGLFYLSLLLILLSGVFSYIAIHPQIQNQAFSAGTPMGNERNPKNQQTKGHQRRYKGILYKTNRYPAKLHPKALWI